MSRPAIRCRRPRSTSPARSVLFLNVIPIFARIARTNGERLAGQGLALGCAPPDGAEKLPPVSASQLEHGSQRFPAGCLRLPSRGGIGRDRFAFDLDGAMVKPRSSLGCNELCRCLLERRRQIQRYSPNDGVAGFPRGRAAKVCRAMLRFRQSHATSPGHAPDRIPRAIVSPTRSSLLTRPVVCVVRGRRRC